MDIDTDRPTIILGLPQSSNGQLPDKLIPLLYGMEEEQIPVQVTTIESNTATERAYEAAIASRLSVGVSYDDQQMVVHYKNLNPESPLFMVPISSDEIIRKVGANAARLVKGVPFKK